jgi:hypothetical protein
MHVFEVPLAQPTTKLAFEQWVREGDAETKELLQRISRTREDFVSALTRSTPDAALRVPLAHSPARLARDLTLCSYVPQSCCVGGDRRSTRTSRASWAWYTDRACRLGPERPSVTPRLTLHACRVVHVVGVV